LTLKKNWTLATADPVRLQKLKHSLRIHPAICQILIQRGITDFDSAKDYFRPDLNQLHQPRLMKDMDKAVDRIYNALESNEKILIYGDYDVDGTTAVASFFQFMRAIHPADQLDTYIPHRYREGYGVSKAGIDFAKNNGFSLIIALDCGIKSVELIGYAATLGIDFIICDHHLPGNELPPAYAILNPKQSDCQYPYKELCGCGVGFKLMQALSERLNLTKESYLEYLDLLAIAIAADIVPMTGENRILAYHGLKKINEQPSIGIRALLQTAGAPEKLTVHHLVFMLAPRINAAGRMDDARKAVLLFAEKDPIQAMEHAASMQSDNSDRKEADQSITKEAFELIEQDSSHTQKRSTVLFQRHWHKGVVGIVASRVIEHHYKPTIILTENDGLLTGSARSVKGFNLYEAIYACREYLTAFGGHFAAAGLSLLPENLESFRHKFEEVVSSTIDPASLVPEISIDAEIELHDIQPNVFRIIQQMEPFGPENLRPIFCCRGVQDSGLSKLVKEHHLRFELIKGFSRINGIGFNLGHHINLVKSGQPFDLVFTIDENHWKNQTHLQVQVIDLKPSA
jgi:single-stranded-DNA-specific exonuclease